MQHTHIYPEMKEESLIQSQEGVSSLGMEVCKNVIVFLILLPRRTGKVERGIQ